MTFLSFAPFIALTRRRHVNSYYQGPVSDHFDGTHFFNPGRRWNKSRSDLLKWWREGGREEWPKLHPSPFQDKPPATVDGDAIRLAYVGHASFLLQVAGLNILIDPVWSERVSPFKSFGPKRVNKPGIALKDLPRIDIVLISHNHYDHLDLATLRAVNRKHRPLFITPLGNDAIIRLIGDKPRIVTRDWGEKIALDGGTEIFIEEAYHWSARGLADRLHALWCAFVIRTKAGVIYAIGDTGFHDGRIFSDVKEKHGPIRLAIIPIGAYEPRWFMAEQHMNPEEAVKAFMLSGAEQAVAHHWGTFQLTNEALHRPPEDLEKALREYAISSDRFLALKPGEVLTCP